MMLDGLEVDLLAELSEAFVEFSDGSLSLILSTCLSLRY